MLIYLNGVAATPNRLVNIEMGNLKVDKETQMVKLAVGGFKLLRAHIIRILKEEELKKEIGLSLGLFGWTLWGIAVLKFGG